MSDFSIVQQLDDMSKNELIKMILHITKESEHSRLLVLEWINENCENLGEANSNKKSAQKLSDELLFEYWKKAQSIIEEFNCYGGGPEEDEEEAYEWLSRISDLIKEDKISKEAKFKFLDVAFIEYDEGNSGFDDGLIDVFFEMCKDKDEWEFLIQKLNRRPTEWRKKLIMKIYRDYLCEEEKYLEERLNNLHYGSDYWDLVQHYERKRKKELALEAALKGIRKGEGRLSALYDYLIEHYIKKQDCNSLEMIAATAIQRKNDVQFVMDRLFEYYKTKDYYKAKEKLLQSYEYSNYKKYFVEYKRMKSFLNAEDFEVIESRIIKDVQKEKAILEYMEICLYKGMKEKVINVIVSPSKKEWGFGAHADFDSFAERLEKDYPNEILNYYYKKAYVRIPNGNRSSYQEAVKYLKKVKTIYTKYLKKPEEWIQLLNNLQMEFKKRPAFIDETKKGKL